MSFLWNLINAPRPPLKLQHWMLLWAAIWTFLYLTLIIPMTAMYYWSATKLTVVEAQYSQHHIVRLGSGRKTSEHVRATVEFNRPSSTGPVHCVVPDQPRPWRELERQSIVYAQLAVRDDSCYGFSDFPIMPDVIRDLFYGYIFGCLFVTGLAIGAWADTKRYRLLTLKRSASGVPLMKNSQAH